MDQKMAEDLRNHIKFLRISEGHNAKEISKAVGKSAGWETQYELREPCQILDEPVLMRLKRYFKKTLKELIQPPPIVFVNLTKAERIRAVAILDKKREEAGLNKYQFSMAAGFHPGYWAGTVGSGTGITDATIYWTCKTLRLDYNEFIKEIKENG